MIYFHMFFPCYFTQSYAKLVDAPLKVTLAHVVASQEQMQRLLQQHIDPVGGFKTRMDWWSTVIGLQGI